MNPSPNTSGNPDKTNHDPLRTVQIGVGGFGAHRRRTMRRTGLFDLVGVYDHHPEVAKAAAGEEDATPTESYEDLLSMPGIEAVVISTGAKFHTEHILAAAERGYHVFVEKPLCATPEEIETIFDAQRRHGIVIGVGHTHHGEDGSSRTIKQMLDSGKLGKAVAFEKTTAHSGGFHIQPGDWRGDPEKNPGGMLFQCGVHAAHELCYYFGPIKEVSARMRYDVHETQTADAAVCSLVFENGVIGNLNAYHTTPYRHTLSIFGTRGAIYRDDRHFDEGTILLHQETHLDGSKEERIPVPITDPGDSAANLRSFFKAVREGGDPYPSVVDGARAVQMVFAAEASVRQGGIPVAVSSQG